MDAAGFGRAHIVGNSLGGYLALLLAARGRAESVVALAPAGGWAVGDGSAREMLLRFRDMQVQLRAAAPTADRIVATAAGRRAAVQYIVTQAEHIPGELIAHIMLGIVRCDALEPLLQFALRGSWEVDAAQVACPVRIVWGTADKVLPWPSAAERFRSEWLPNADWIELDGVGHCPQLDVPVEAAQLILGSTNR